MFTSANSQFDTSCFQATACPRAGSPMGHRRAPDRTPRSVLPYGRVRPPPFEARISARTQEDDRFHVVEVRRPRLPLAELAPGVVDLPIHECPYRAPAQRERVLDHTRRLHPRAQYVRWALVSGARGDRRGVDVPSVGKYLTAVTRSRSFRKLCVGQRMPPSSKTPRACTSRCSLRAARATPSAARAPPRPATAARWRPPRRAAHAPGPPGPPGPPTSPRSRWCARPSGSAHAGARRARTPSATCCAATRRARTWSARARCPRTRPSPRATAARARRPPGWRAQTRTSASASSGARRARCASASTGDGGGSAEMSRTNMRSSVVVRDSSTLALPASGASAIA
jgi:hypothetical protein